MLVGQIAGNAQLAAAGDGSKRFDFESILVEFESSMQLAEAVGNVFKRQGGVLNIDATAEAGIGEGAVSLDLEGGVSTGGEVGVEGLCDG